MGKVLQPPPRRAASAAEQNALAELRIDYPGWWIGITPGRLVPWDAKRRRDAFWRGGVWAVEATSAELLRDLLREVQILDAKHTSTRS